VQPFFSVANNTENWDPKNNSATVVSRVYQTLEALNQTSRESCFLKKGCCIRKGYARKCFDNLGFHTEMKKIAPFIVTQPFVWSF